jgi:hypothetical protein
MSRCPVSRLNRVDEHSDQHWSGTIGSNAVHCHVKKAATVQYSEVMTSRNSMLDHVHAQKT